MFLYLLCVCPQVFGLKLFQIVSVQLTSAHLSLVCLTFFSLFFSFGSSSFYTYKPQPVYSCRQTHSHYKFQMGEHIKSLWVTNLKTIVKSEGSGSTKLDIDYYFLQIFTSGTKTPLYKVRIHLCWKNVNLASMSEHEIQVLAQLGGFGSPSS